LYGTPKFVLIVSGWQTEKKQETGAARQAAREEELAAKEAERLAKAEAEIVAEVRSQHQPPVMQTIQKDRNFKTI
jgi:hypothetical protein